MSPSRTASTDKKEWDYHGGSLPCFGGRIREFFFLVLFLLMPWQKTRASTPYAAHFGAVGMAESAASLGTLGMRFSGGLTRLPHADGDLTASGLKGLKPGENPLTQRLWLAKGFSLPINVGLVLSQLPELGWLDVTSYLQGTLYEAHARPAWALRVSYGKSFGVARAQVSTTGVDTVLSYGFFRYFSMFGVLGVRRFKMDLYAPSSSTEMLGSTEENSDLSSDLRLRTHGEWGIQVAFIPAFAALTLSSSLTDGQYATHTAKVTLSI